MSKVKEELKPGKPWKGWGSLGSMDVVGHEIVESLDGPRLDALETGEFMYAYRPYDIMYRHSYGIVSKFFTGLLRKKIFGTRCPKCGDVFCPPRAHCWRNECALQETESIELPLTGVLHSYTILGFATEAFLRDLPFILAYVRVDGANTLIAGRLREIEPEEVECDIKVRVKFVAKPKGSPLDFYFVPAERPMSKRTAEQRKRLVGQLEVIEEWVKKKFGRK